MLIANTIFRVGGAVVLLTNKRAERRRAEGAGAGGAWGGGCNAERRGRRQADRARR